MRAERGGGELRRELFARLGARAEERELARLAVARGARGQLEGTVERVEQLGAVSRQRVERAALDQRLEDLAVEISQIDPFGEVEEVGERTACRSRPGAARGALLSTALLTGEAGVENA